VSCLFNYFTAFCKLLVGSIFCHFIADQFSVTKNLPVVFRIRTQSVKFMEGVVLLQTYADANSMGRNDDFTLEDIPLTLKIARRRKLEEEAK